MNKTQKIIGLLGLIHSRDQNDFERRWELLYADKHRAPAQPGDPIISDIRSGSYDNFKFLADSRNPKARIGFFIQHPFQYYIYKNVYALLKNEAEFIIDTTLLKSSNSEWFTVLQKTGEFLKKDRANFRYFSWTEKNYDNFFAPYSVLVSHYANSVLKLGCNRDKKKIRMMYGHSKDMYNFGPWTRFFDAALAYGPYSHEYLKFFTESHIVGNPKFDDWFNNCVNTQSISSIQIRLDRNKKTLLYLPTHGNLSSLDMFESYVKDISRRYNLIVKPHHITLYGEPKRRISIENIKADGAIFADDFTDILPLLKISDAVILDNSGAIFDAVLAGKPVILMDFLDENFFRSRQWSIDKRNDSGFIFPLTYENSIEQRIKLEDDIRPGPVIKDFAKLDQALTEALKQPDNPYAERQKKLREMLFAETGGGASAKAAAVIRSFLEREAPPKTFWALSDEAEAIRGYTANSNKLNELNRTASDYVNLDPLKARFTPSSPVKFSVVLPTFNRYRKLASALHSLAAQKNIGKQEYEVIVVDDGSSDETRETTKKFMHENPELMLRYLGLKKNHGAGFARNIGTNAARSDIIAFTDDDCTVPENWLESAGEIFTKHKEIAGAGGWRVHTKDNRSIYAKFLMTLESRWMTETQKSAQFAGTQAGDTASMFYKKHFIKELGGFDDSFKLPNSPCLEDWELKARMHAKKYALLYSPELVVRHSGQPGSLKSFIRHYNIRGWGYFLLSHRYPDLAQYDFTFSRTLAEIFMDLKKIRESGVTLPYKAAFAALAFLKNTTIWWGRYRGGLSLMLRPEKDA